MLFLAIYKFKGYNKLMTDILKQKLETLPTDSGVYVMRNVDGEVIYVGKAKNLKNRVSSYFRKDSARAQKVKSMVEKIYDLDYFITLSEQDALALESNLIKKYQPFFNILLKDGKAFPYIKISLNEDFPKLEIVRRLKKDKAKYFGPYFGGISASEILKTINSAFPVRTCNLKIVEGKKAKRECLNYSLGLCSAPCTGRITKAEYSKILDKITDFLNGNDHEIEKILKEKMEKEAERENFEKALELRDRLKMIAKLKERVIANMPKDVTLDAFAFDSNGLSGAISTIVVRGGKILGVQNLSVIDASIDEGEALSSFIVQYYKHQKVPKVILTSAQISNSTALEEFLGEEHKVDVVFPQKGYKKSIIDMAKKNAREHLEKFITKDKQKYNRTYGALEQLQKELNLSRLPKRIECYDISNTSGVLSVASMVVFENGEPKRSHYRKFKIKTVDGPNDFASLKEVLSRRLAELDKGENESFKNRPDLIVIDGGKGQLSSTYEVIKPYGIDTISLAKQFEEVYFPNNSIPKMLKRGSAELKILQNIRDEAHRFAITFHKSLRNKNTFKSPLDDIYGLGEIKKAALLKTFKTSEGVAAASIEELNLVRGIDLALATRIYNYFHKSEEK